MLGNDSRKITLEKLREQLNFKDSGIFEKTVNAFNLLNDLVGFYPNLIFKGGTSLLLHIFPPVRFSIDIDILLPEREGESLFASLEKLVAASQLFDSFEENKRESTIPKAHYKFFYDSYYARDKQYILLDVVFCEHSYHNLVKKNIKEHPLILFDTNRNVKIPTIDGLFGDKMTAISPKTTGLKLEREMEFVKQIIDLGWLFDNLSDINDVRDTFIKTVKQENGFRNTKHSIKDILNDIKDIAFKYSQYLLKRSNNDLKEIKHINGGLTRIDNHLLSRYRQIDLKVAFAKIAYMCQVIEDKIQEEIVKNIDIDIVKGKKLSEKYAILERLKEVNQKAYFYWMLGYGN